MTGRSEQPPWGVSRTLLGRGRGLVARAWNLSGGVVSGRGFLLWSEGCVVTGSGDVTAHVATLCFDHWWDRPRDACDCGETAPTLGVWSRHLSDVLARSVLITTPAETDPMTVTVVSSTPGRMSPNDTPESVLPDASATKERQMRWRSC